MMPRLRYMSPAKEDLGQIWEYHAELVSIKTADAIVARIHDRINRLICPHPLSGRLRSEFGDAVGSVPVLPYVVFYRFAHREIQVLRVLHGHRDIHKSLISFLVAA